MGGWIWKHSCSEHLQRTFLSPQKYCTPNPCSEIPHYFLAVLLELKLAMQTGLRPLWGVHLWVAIILQQLSFTRSGLHCQISLAGWAGELHPQGASMCNSPGVTVEAVQGPCAVLPWAIVSQRLELSTACIPVWDSASR